MAIYHLSVKTVSRSAGRSATAAAAYRAGVSITDQRTGEIHDYSRKSGVQSATLVVPGEAAGWANDREVIWNAAEQAETRKNSTVAREFEIALPSELSAEERKQLAIDFAHELVARHGCAADVAIHAPGKEGDNRNHHAHILLTTRRLTPDGMGEKTRELDDQKTGKQLVTQWRERFATLQNERLRSGGHSAQVDHRSNADRGIDAQPGYHLGPQLTAMTRRGNKSKAVKRENERRALAEQQAREASTELEKARGEALVASRDLKFAELEASIFDDLKPPQSALERKVAEMQKQIEREQQELLRQAAPAPVVESIAARVQREALEDLRRIAESQRKPDHDPPKSSSTKASTPSKPRDDGPEFGR